MPCRGVAVAGARRVAACVRRLARRVGVKVGCGVRDGPSVTEAIGVHVGGSVLMASPPIGLAVIRAGAVADAPFAVPFVVLRGVTVAA